MAKFVYCYKCGKKVIEIKKGIIQSGCRVTCRECKEREKIETPEFLNDLFNKFGGTR